MDRASYEAGFRAAQEQNLQQPPEQGNQFLDAVGKTALGLGVAYGTFLGGRRLMRGRGNVRPTSKPQQGVVDIDVTPTGSQRDRVEQNARTAVNELQKRTGSLQTGVKLPLASEVEYEAPGRIDPRDFASTEVKEARRQQATQDLLAAQQARTGTFQPEIPGVKGDLMAIRSKEGFDPQMTGEVTPSAPSRPLSAAPDQLSIDFSKKYLVDKGYIDTSVEVQKSNQPLVSNQSAEAIDTGADQEAMRVSRTVQRDPGENLAEFELTQDRLEQRGASPVEAADAAVVVTEGEIPFTQTDAPVQGPISAQETADAALAEMKARRAEVAATGLQPGTTRYERALAQSFRTSANVKPQMTGESMAKTALPAGPIRQTVQSAGAVDFETLPERSVVNIGPEAVVTKTARGTAIRGASPVLEQAPPVSRQRPIFGTADTNVPGAPDDYMPDRPARETALSQIETQPQERIDPYALRQEEGGGPAGIGVYGVEPSYVPGAQSKSTGLMSAASERKPTDVRQSALDKVRNPYSKLSDQELGQISMTGTASEAYNASKQLTKRRSIDASREIQQLQKSGRPDAQQLVQQYIQDLKQG
jgi:hypothetical protein